MKQDNEFAVREYIEDYVPSFTPCISTETSLKWIERMANTHGLRRLDDDNLDRLQTSLGFTLSEKDKKDFLKIWNEIFKRVMLEYQADLKKCKSEEEKDKLKKHGVKRKTQEGETSKKKSKKK